MTCPYCHAVERFGTRLPALKGEILDCIKAAGDLGISSMEIVHHLYRDRRPVSPTCIKSHTLQINDLLAATDWRIRSEGGRWFLRHEKTHDQK
jgi:hypothetical protein